MEQIINDWQRDGGSSKPISLGDLNKHSRPNFRIGFSLWDGVEKEEKQTVQRSKNLLSPHHDHKELFVPGRESKIMAGVHEAVR